MNNSCRIGFTPVTLACRVSSSHPPSSRWSDIGGGGHLGDGASWQSGPLVGAGRCPRDVTAVTQPALLRHRGLRGSEELSSSFDRSSHFYDREGAGGYIRRSGSYHSQGESLSRNRTRDRTAYRNGPYTPIIER
ncbi:unnamed protein product [Nezara viridula]|uniref:Uncharacterized protein n=1 Tax=Nezara viridula TaxID=85310 RepID=A0A9P0HRW9_NEZVI|nr:unnamed protein product [Nezara viridula]